MSGVSTSFADVATALLGDMVDLDGLEAIAKMSPDPSETHAPGMLVIAGGRRRRKVTKASHAKLRRGYLQQARRLAGTAPLPKALRLSGIPDKVGKLDDQTKRRATALGSFAGAGVGAFGAGVAVNEIRRNSKIEGSLKAGLRATPKTTRWLLPAEVAGVGIETAAGHILHSDTQQPRRGVLQKFSKDDQPGDITFAGTFSKFDDDKRLAFGWASVVELNGEPVIDRQGDVITVDEIENAGYEYMLNSRVGGRMHERTDDDKPVHISDVVESVIFTPEKCTAMGISKNVSGRWWLGVKVREDDDWSRVRKGEWTGFSIHGKGLRKSTTVEELMQGLAR